MAATRRPQRTKSQLPSLYYEGFLEKRSFKDRIGRQFWASLCGNCLFFYNNSKDNNYVEKLDLSTLINVTDDLSHDRRLDAARFHLHLKGEDIYLTAPSLEARELWKGFIFSVVKLEVPTSLNLLPGQINMLREAVDKEIERLKENEEKSASLPPSITVATTEPNNYMTVLSEMPACYHRVFREDAETLLEKNKDKGNLLLRPSRDGSSFAVTTRQEFNGPDFRHYRVTRIPDGKFAIVLDNPIPCTSLHDVISYLMEKTGVFKPLVLEQTYDETIKYVDNDKENGEKLILDAPSSPVAPKTPPKPATHLEHQASMSDLQISPNGALLPPTSRPRSVSETPADLNPWRSVPSKSPVAPKTPPKPEHVKDNKENGEKPLLDASKSPVAPKTPPKPAKKFPSFFSDPKESIYENSSDEEDISPIVNCRNPATHLVHQASMPDLQISPNGALLPPTFRPRSVSETPADLNPRRSVSDLAVTGILHQKVFAELKQKVQQRTASE